MPCIASSRLSVRAFSIDSDSTWLHALWHRTLHERWAISFQAMLNVLANGSLLHVAESGGKRAGFCAVDSLTEPSAGLTLLLVEPDLQHRGIGSQLYMLSETILREQKREQLRVGAGNGDYFWPGIPSEHDEAWSFFRKRGFKEQEQSEDLVVSLDSFKTPSWVVARQSASGTTIHMAQPSRTAELLAFEKRHFPAWLPYFEGELEQGNFHNVLFTQGKDSTISATTLVRNNAATPWLKDARNRTGTLNTLGVVPDKQGKGIGLALTAGAMEYLQQRGCSSCYIQWTGLRDWYGKLGARPWAGYRMATKAL